MNNLSGFQRDVLVAIHQIDRPNGRDIANQLGSWYDATRVPDGRIYPALNRLEELGLVSVHRSDIPRNGYVYEVTDKGQRTLRDIARAYQGIEKDVLPRRVRG